MSEWISVKERLPDFREHGFHTGRKLIVRYADGEITNCALYHGYGLAGSAGEQLREFTHWMSEPPK